MTTRSRTGLGALSARPALVLAAATLIAGCAGVSAGGGGEGEASCAFVVEFEGRSYHDLANIEFTAGREIGTAVLPHCDDMGGSVDGDGPEEEQEQEVYRAYEIKGLDTADAIAVRHAPADDPSFMVRGGEPLPAEVQKLVDDLEEKHGVPDPG